MTPAARLRLRSAGHCLTCSHQLPHYQLSNYQIIKFKLMKTQLTLRMPGQMPSSYHIHLLGICLCLVTACSVFKEKSFFETDSLQRRDSSREMKSETRTSGRALRITSTEDSANTQTWSEIFPQGTFKYSVKEGFEGKAGRLLIHQSLQQMKKVHDSSATSNSVFKKEKLEETAKQIDRKTLKRKEITTSRLNYWYLAGLLGIFLGIYLGRRFLVR